MRIKHTAADPPGGISLERRDDVVIVERTYGSPCGTMDIVQIRVPLVELWKLLVDEDDFRFDDLSADRLRSAVDHARWHGWGG